MLGNARFDGRSFDEIRKTTIERNFLKYPEGSVLITQGNTKVIVTASVLENVPKFLVDTGTGWITAEYNMLPRATQNRNSRERERSIKGRTHEIQRLIGRSMRAAFNYDKIGERTIRIDCDVIQADGGTRCASITGAFVAVFDAINYEEDSKVDVDFNLVANEDLELIEIQGTAEGLPFNKEKLNEIIEAGEKGIMELIKIQKNVLNL